MEFIKDGGKMVTKKYSFVNLKSDTECWGSIFNGIKMVSLFTHKQFKNGLEAWRAKSLGYVNGDLMYKYIYNEGRKYGIQGSVLCNGGKDLVDKQ